MWKTLKYDGKEYEDFIINEFGEIIKISTNRKHNSYIHNGYMLVSLHLGGRNNIKSIRLHKALAETFIPNPNGYSIVHHKDANRLNNNLDNLIWVNDEQHQEIHLELCKTKGFSFKGRKLTPKQVSTIKDMSKNKKIAEIAPIFNVSRTTIYNILQNKLYLK